MGVKKQKTVVIYGGAFNPPHRGHATVIETVMRLFPCDEISLMPTADRKDKIISTDGKHRMQMLRIMIRELFPSSPIPITVSDIELRRKKLTTTYDTARELTATYKNVRFYFVVGSDIAGDIETKWVNGKKLIRIVKFIIFKRSPAFTQKNYPPHAIILEKDTIHLDFSSTFIRALFKQGLSGLPYISPAVAAYIRKHRLYS